MHTNCHRQAGVQCHSLAPIAGEHTLRRVENGASVCVDDPISRLLRVRQTTPVCWEGTIVWAAGSDRPRSAAPHHIATASTSLGRVSLGLHPHGKPRSAAPLAWRGERLNLKMSPQPDMGQRSRREAVGSGWVGWWGFGRLYPGRRPREMGDSGRTWAAYTPKLVMGQFG